MTQTSLFNKPIPSFKINTPPKRERKRLIYIAYEGTVTEREYFSAIERKYRSKADRNVKIMPVNRMNGDGASHPTQVRDFIKNKYTSSFGITFDHKIDELWIVVDVDQHFKASRKRKTTSAEDDYATFLSSLSISKDVMINLAISNPCFEIWLMLHIFTFEELDDLGMLSSAEIKKQWKMKSGSKKKQSELVERVQDALDNSRHGEINKETELMLTQRGTNVSKLIEIVT